MLSVGIVGSDNSHALAYSSLLNVEQVAGDSARATCIWGAEADRTREVADKAGIERIVATPEAMLDHVDVVFVEDRHGGLHAAHALPFLERGIPVFVDKPLAISLADCGRIIAAANASGAWLTSFSSLRTCATTDALARQAESIGTIRVAQFAGPCDFESVYGGAWFYGTHTVEIALRLVGEEVRSVRARREGRAAVVDVLWHDGALGTISYLGDAAYHFHATLFGKDGMASGEVIADHGGYRTALGVVLDHLQRDVRPFDDRQLVRPIAIMHAIEQSLTQGGAEVAIEPLIEQALALANPG
jgi:predicted dehydrogenase